MRITVIIFLLGLITTCSLQGQTSLQNINTEEFTETTPFVSFDGTKLVYTSNKSGTWQIYQCNKTDNKTWSNPELVVFEGISLGVGVQIYDPALSAMANTMYFSAQLNDTKGGKDIYYSILKEGKWQAPINLSEINTTDNESAPMVSADNNYLFFARDFIVDKDEIISKILYTWRNKNRNWAEPATLTDKINASDESYPFLCEDNRVMFFASKRNKDPKGYNLFVTSMVAKNVWTDPYPISGLNTDFDDIRPSKAANSNILYFAQFYQKRKETLGKLHTSKIPDNKLPKKVFEFKGIITDTANKPLESTIIVRYSDNMEKIGEQNTKMPEGSYHFYFAQGRKLEFEVFANNYSHSFYEYDASFDTKIPSEPIVNNLQLFNKSTLLLNVFDQEIFEPLKADIKIFDTQGEDISLDKIKFKDNGRYELSLEIGYTYKIIVSTKNYNEYSFNVNLSGIVQYNKFEKDIELSPSKSGFEISISDMDTDQAIDEVEITITNLDKNETIVKRVRRDENGKFVVDLRDGDKYNINVNGPKGYAFYNTEVDMASGENKKLEVKLMPLKAKTKLVLNDITFETNSAELNASSFAELDRVVKLLTDNPEINIEISAHTDDIGSNVYNKRLSLKRAQSVVDYLTNNKLPIDRLLPKGYGETTPLVANNSDDNRAKNRRVELKIIDIN